jgi:archaemetzincin
MEIVIQPLLTTLNHNTLNELADNISTEFEHIRVTITSVVNNFSNSSLKSDAALQSTFDSDRNQWNSPKLLEWFYKKFKPKKDKIVLLILDVDAYSNGLNFVLGEAFPKGGLGVVYLPRIKEEFYGLKPNDKLFYKRMVKECVHELGHIFDFNHCPNRLCVMHFSNSLNDTDVKGKSFCDKCRMKKPIF